MSEKLKRYRVIYRPDNAQTDVESVDLAGRSKADALMCLVNYTVVYNIYGIERVKDD